jgi:hypothetical protein
VQQLFYLFLHLYRLLYNMFFNRGSSWSWSYDNWIFNYLCNPVSSTNKTDGHDIPFVLNSLQTWTTLFKMMSLHNLLTCFVITVWLFLYCGPFQQNERQCWTCDVFSLPSYQIIWLVTLDLWHGLMLKKKCTYIKWDQDMYRIYSITNLIFLK